MPIKITAADRNFALAVKESRDWVCEKCNTRHERGSQGLHLSHVFSRRHRTVRFDTLNGQALCFSCHSWYGGNPADSGIWVANHLGEEKMALLREKLNAGFKVPKSEEKAISKHYIEQRKFVESLRRAGQQGYIEIVSYF